MEIEKIQAAVINATPIFALLPTGKVFACRSVFESYTPNGSPVNDSQRVFLVFAGDSSEIVRVPAARLFEDRKEAFAASLGLLADRIHEYRLAIEALEVAAVANSNALNLHLIEEESKKRAGLSAEEIEKLWESAWKKPNPAAIPMAQKPEPAPEGYPKLLAGYLKRKNTFDVVKDYFYDLASIPWPPISFERPSVSADQGPYTFHPEGFYTKPVFKCEPGPAVIDPRAFIVPPGDPIPAAPTPPGEYVKGLEPTAEPPAYAVPLAMEPAEELPGEKTEVIRGPIPEPISAELAEHAKAVRDSEIPF